MPARPPPVTRPDGPPSREQCCHGEHDHQADFGDLHVSPTAAMSESDGMNRDHPQPNKPLRSRDLGVVMGTMRPGRFNSITDVSGIEVGHSTIVDAAAGIYSGVTAIVHDQLRSGARLPAGLFVGNGFGKFVGATQVMELGQIETPVLLTSTLSTFLVADGLVAWALDTLPTRPTTINPVVGEINDSWLCGGGHRSVTHAHVRQALTSAAPGPVEMGNVGGGTGACALGFKAGIGSSSRQLDRVAGGTIGVLVQSNMGGDLTIGRRVIRPRELGLKPAGPRPDDGSCVVVAAVDFPCASNDLSRIARRLVFALGRVGASYSHGSGDYGLAFSVDPDPGAAPMAGADLDLVFAAAMDCVQEAVVDSILCAETVHTPSGRIAHGLPHAALVD